jgi:hypothetical protein
MIIVVNDANILIDLVQLDLLSNFFELEFKFHTTDLVLNELHKHQQDKLLPYIEDQVLIVMELSDVHGHLWVFDRMIESSTIMPDEAIDKLDELCFKINTQLKLPVAECEKRKIAWSNLAE